MFIRRPVQRLRRNLVELVGPGGPVPPIVSPTLKLWTLSTFGVNELATGVNLWRDQSGNGIDLTQTDTTQQPAFSNTSFNGFPGLTFDGVNDILTTASYGTGLDGEDVPFTVICAARWVSTAADKGMWAMGNASSAQQFHMYRSGPVARHVIRRDDDAGGSVSVNGVNNGIDTNVHVFSQVFTGTTVSFWEDGIVDANINAAAMNVGVCTFGTFAVAGKLATSEGDFANVVIAEMMVDESALSTANRNAWEAAMKARWGTP